MPGRQGQVRSGRPAPLDVPPPAAVSATWPARTTRQRCSGVSVLPGCSLQCAENTKFLVRASYLEIYNEDVRDLLGTDAAAAGGGLGAASLGWVSGGPGGDMGKGPLGPTSLPSLPRWTKQA